MTGWEEYSLITATETLFKIHDKDVPLSYYIGILGKPFRLLELLYLWKQIIVGANKLIEIFNVLFDFLRILENQTIVFRTR